MDIFFQDPNIVRVPPEEVRLLDVKVTPQPESGRVKIYIELTPFMKRPNVNVSITNKAGKEIAHTSILETMLPKMEFTMHLRQPEPGSEYSVDTWVYYQRMPEPSEIAVEIPLPDPMIVDRSKTTFILPLVET
jgi:hypothetical protein